MSARIHGRAALTRSLRLLMVRIHRFGVGRARTPSDRMWAARAVDTLQTALDVADAEHRGAVAEHRVRTERA